MGDREGSVKVKRGRWIEWVIGVVFFHFPFHFYKNKKAKKKKKCQKVPKWSFKFCWQAQLWIFFPFFVTLTFLPFFFSFA